MLNIQINYPAEAIQDVAFFEQKAQLLEAQVRYLFACIRTSESL